jgi:Fe-S cluster assembly protein SufB
MGFTKEVIEDLVLNKGEKEWMRKFRLLAYSSYQKMKLPEWGVDLGGIDFDKIYYYLKPVEKIERSWEMVPEAIKQTFEKIGVPAAEREVLAGVKGQFDSEVVYGSLKKSLAKKGVIFESMDEAVLNHSDLVREYFGKIVPIGDNKLAALNSAVWSGGSFIYVPKGVEVELPLQAYFRMNAERAGQFERTLIVADEGSKLHYIEGCSAPVYSTASLHSAVVEVVVKKGARVQYTTVQNWYKNVYNLVTKRAVVEEEGKMRWVDGNLGSKVTMKYPSCILLGRKAKGEMLSLSWAGKGQHQDTGAKMIHLASETSSRIVSKSVSKSGGRSSYRGLVKIGEGAFGSRNMVRCDGLMLDDLSRTDAYPTSLVMEKDAIMEHEASVGKLGEEQLFYLMSRGLSIDEAEAMVVNGFLEPIIKEIPLEYAVEMNRLVSMEMEE